MRSQPSQARSRRTVEAVLEAANAEFSEHGFHAAQMTRIADRAGVSPGSMYRFFPDKTDLAGALSEAYLEAFAERLGPIVTQFQSFSDLEMTVKALLDEGAALQHEHSGYYRLTADVSPLAEHWVDQGVLDPMADLFVAQLESAGCRAAPGTSLREAMVFIIETARSWLTHIPLEGPTRPKLLEELRVMLTAYMQQRVVPPDGRPLASPSAILPEP